MQGTQRQYDLKQVRALANLTQKQTAKLLNVHPNTYHKLEQTPGLMTLDQAWIIAEAAGIGVEQIKTTA